MYASVPFLTSELVRLSQILRAAEQARFVTSASVQMEGCQRGGRQRHLSGGSTGTCERGSPSPSSVGEAAPHPQPQQSGPARSQRYKTELCRQYAESGSCKYGDKCQFAHGLHELRSVTRHPKYKTDLCRNFNTTGFCPYGPRCHFIHNADERRSTEPSFLQATSAGPVPLPVLPLPPVPVAPRPAVRPALSSRDIDAICRDTWQLASSSDDISSAVASMIATL